MGEELGKVLDHVCSSCVLLVSFFYPFLFTLVLFSYDVLSTLPFSSSCSLSHSLVSMRRKIETTTLKQEETLARIQWLPLAVVVEVVSPMIPLRYAYTVLYLSNGVNSF